MVKLEMIRQSILCILILNLGGYKGSAVLASV